MNKNIIVISTFILLALLQLYFPAKMILDREDILATGKEFKFRTAAVDPNDPFRGKYISLNYKDNEYEIENKADWKKGEDVYLVLIDDNEGFAKIDTVLRQKPDDNPDFLKIKLSNIYNEPPRLRFRFPFDRFYMEESKAYEAEVTYNESSSDSINLTYALINIKDGEAVLKDVIINEKSIRLIVKEKLEAVQQE